MIRVESVDCVLINKLHVALAVVECIHLLRLKVYSSTGHSYIPVSSWSSIYLVLVSAFFRWLLLSFKREFSFSEALTLFEILSSHHLEMCSLEAEKAKRKEELLEKERMGKFLTYCS